jgi:hypothetical protein
VSELLDGRSILRVRFFMRHGERPHGYRFLTGFFGGQGKLEIADSLRSR